MANDRERIERAHKYVRQSDREMLEELRALPEDATLDESQRLQLVSVLLSSKITDEEKTNLRSRFPTESKKSDKFARRGAIGCLALVVAVIGGCTAFYELTPAGKQIMADNDRQQAAAVTNRAQEPKLVRPDLDNYENAHYNSGHLRAVYATHSYPMEEAMTDEGWAKSLILAREVGNADGIRMAYDQGSYHHFNPAVLCKVVDQPERTATDPVTCVVQAGDLKGETVFATAIATGI